MVHSCNVAVNPMAPYVPCVACEALFAKGEHPAQRPVGYDPATLRRVAGELDRLILDLDPKERHKVRDVEQRLLREAEAPRAAGQTRHMMSRSPKGAIYVWCTGNTSWAEDIALSLGRGDLQIKPLGWLRKENVLGLSEYVVVDHEVKPNAEIIEALEEIARQARMRREGGGG